MSSPDPTRTPAERAASLADALAAVGVPVGVEVDGAVAVLVERSGRPRLDWPAVRADVVRLAQAHGFRAVALDLAPPTG